MPRRIKAEEPRTWMPVFIGDYLRDTMHFKCRHHGAYMLLLFSGWYSGGELPDNDELLATIARCELDEWLAIRPIVAAKFDISGGVWRQKRQQEEIQRARANILSKKENGRKGGKARKRKGSEREANGTELVPKMGSETEAKRTPSPSPSPKDLGFPNGNPLSGEGSPDGTRDELNAKRREAREAQTRHFNAQASKLLAFLNDKGGKRFPATPTNVGIITARLREGEKHGYGERECRQVIAMKCREWKDDPDKRAYLRPATLFGALKFSQYLGELGPDEADLVEQSTNNEEAA